MQNRIFITIFTLVVLSSCSLQSFRQQIGLSRKSPDEFMVMPREKLIIPSQAVALPEPTEKTDGAVLASDNAQKAIFGDTTQPARANTALENSVMEKTGKADDNIRKQVNEEYKDKTGVFGTKRGGTMEAILDPLGYNAPKEKIVDTKKENKRIKDAIAKGEKVDAKGVVTKDPRKEKWEKKKDKDEAVDPAYEEPAPTTEELLSPSNLPVN